jgi:hypothetical protein
VIGKRDPVSNDFADIELYAHSLLLFSCGSRVISSPRRIPFLSPRASDCLKVHFSAMAVFLSRRAHSLRNGARQHSFERSNGAGCNFPKLVGIRRNVVTPSIGISGRRQSVLTFFRAVCCRERPAAAQKLPKESFIGTTCGPVLSGNCLVLVPKTVLRFAAASFD